MGPELGIALVVEQEPEIAPAAAELAIVPVVEELEQNLVAAELERDPVAEELEQNPVAEPEHVPVAAELEHDPVVVELELVQVEAVLAPSHRRAQLAAALRTKSVIAAHRRGLVPLLAVEDSAAAAVETTREPVAVEAVIAWEAADTVAAVVAAAAVTEAAAEDVEAAAEDGDKRSMRKNKMKSRANIMTSSKFFVIACAIVNCIFLVLASQAAPEPKQESNPVSSQPQQKQFDTPKQAADALIQVASNFDTAAAKEILGPESDDIIASEDPVQDKNRAEQFAAKAKEKTSIEIDKKDPNRAILLVGNDDFPLPIPLVKRKGKWSFDTKVGREEILNRRIGANELNAIQICRGFVEAQKEYAAEKHDDSQVNQYAQRIISTPGKHDGLAWQNPDGTWAGPVGEGVAKALEQGYSNPSQPQPYHGYYFKVLKGQGPAAPLGQIDYVVKGSMIGGFALAAAPAQYRVTGVETFIVSHDGVVHEKDLGPDTLKTFQSMDKYNPDKTWKVTEDDVEDDSQE